MHDALLHATTRAISEDWNEEMSGRTFRVHSKKGDPFSVLLDSRLKDETLLFESGAVAELSMLLTI